MEPPVAQSLSLRPTLAARQCHTAAERQVVRREPTAVEQCPLDKSLAAEVTYGGHYASS